MRGVDGVVESWSVDNCQSQLDAFLLDLHVLLLNLNRPLDSLYHAHRDRLASSQSQSR